MKLKNVKTQTVCGIALVLLYLTNTAHKLLSRVYLLHLIKQPNAFRPV